MAWSTRSWCGQRCIDRVGAVAALPLWTWLLTVAAMTLGGPGDDIILGGRGVMAYGAVLLIALGVVPPVWLVLWRRRRAQARHGPGRQV